MLETLSGIGFDDEVAWGAIGIGHATAGDHDVVHVHVLARESLCCDGSLHRLVDLDAHPGLLGNHDGGAPGRMGGGGSPDPDPDPVLDHAHGGDGQGCPLGHLVHDAIAGRFLAATRPSSLNLSPLWPAAGARSGDGAGCSLACESEAALDTHPGAASRCQLAEAGRLC